MQNRLKVFLLLHFCTLERKVRWKVHSALILQEISCASPCHSYQDADDPDRVQRWKEIPPGGRRGFVWSCNLFYLCAFRIASYFLKKIHLCVLVISERLPKSFLPGYISKENYLHGPLPKYLPIEAAQDFGISPLMTPWSNFGLPSPATSSCWKCHLSDQEGPLPLSFSCFWSLKREIHPWTNMHLSKSHQNAAWTELCKSKPCRSRDQALPFLQGTLLVQQSPLRQQSITSSPKGSHTVSPFQPGQQCHSADLRLLSALPARGGCLVTPWEGNCLSQLAQQILPLLCLPRFLLPNRSTSVYCRTRKALSLGSNHFLSWLLPCD